MTLQATGNNNNAWGTILNGSALQTVERALCGNIGHAVTGGTLDLSGTPPPAGVTQALDFVQIITGVLTSNQTIIMPNLSKTWFIVNNTTGAFSLFVQASGGTAIQIPQGSGKFVVCDGATNLYRLDRDSVGTFVYGAIVPSDALACSGQSLLRASYPDLFAKIGTTFGSVDSTHFTLPLLTDTGRFLRSTTGTLTVGTYQANQNKSHTHTGSGTTATESVGHTHTQQGTFSSGGVSAFHTHQYTAPATPVGLQGGSTFNGNIASGTASTSGDSVNQTHDTTISGQTGTVSALHTHTYRSRHRRDRRTGQRLGRKLWPSSSAFDTERSNPRRSSFDFAEAPSTRSPPSQLLIRKLPGGTIPWLDRRARRANMEFQRDRI